MIIKTNGSLIDWAYFIFLLTSSFFLSFCCYMSVISWLKNTTVINTLAMLLVLPAVILYFYILFKYIIIIKVKYKKQNYDVK
jgi:hypothetical protein